MQAELNDLTIRLPRKSTLNTTRTESATSRLINENDRCLLAPRRHCTADSRAESERVTFCFAHAHAHAHAPLTTTNYTPLSCGLPTQKDNDSTKFHHPPSNISLDSLHASRRSFNQLTFFFFCFLSF